MVDVGFDQRVQYHQRLDEIMKWNLNAMMNKDVEKWFLGTDALAIEVLPFKSSKNLNEAKKVDEIKKGLAECRALIYESRFSKARERVSAGLFLREADRQVYQRELPKIFKMLEELTYDLRVFMKRKRMLLPMKGNGGNAVV